MLLEYQLFYYYPGLGVVAYIVEMFATFTSMNDINMY